VTSLAADYLRLDLRIPLRDLRAMLMTPKRAATFKRECSHTLFGQPKFYDLFSERLSLFVCPLKLLRLYVIPPERATSFCPE
jgi:hypothetical protein